MDYTLVSPAAIFLLFSLVISRHLFIRMWNGRKYNLHLVPRAPTSDSVPLLGHELSIFQHDESVMYTRWIQDVAQVFRVQAAFGHDDLVSLTLSPSASRAHDPCPFSIAPLARCAPKTFPFLNVSQLLIADHAAARHVFANTDTYIRAPAFRKHSANLIAQGLVWAEGAQHRVQRRVIAPCFATEPVRDMMPVVKNATQKLCTYKSCFFTVLINWRM